MGTALVCDICGGKLVMGSGGIATCDSCGMEYTADRMKEKVHEIKGTVKVDNSHLFTNFIEMAETALDAENNKEAENYCNKIIENDPTQYKAWFLKGKAAGWQSTLANNRFSESANCFGKAIEYAPEEEKNEIKESGANEIKKLGLALMRLRGEHFAKFPDEDELQNFLSDRIIVLNTVTKYLLRGGSVPEEYTSEIATIMNNAACEAWGNVVDEFGNDDDTGHPGDYAWKRMIEKAGYCTALIEQAIEFDDNDEEQDIQRYENLITIHEFCINSCSYEKQYTDYGSYWTQNYTLTNDAKRNRRQLINTYNQKIAQIKTDMVEKSKLEKKQKITQYWEEHKEEKEKLEQEKRDLETKINELDDSIKDEVSRYEQEKNSVIGPKEVEQFQLEIDKLEKDKKAISILKLKERKTIQEQIKDIEKKQNEVKKRMQAEKDEIQKKIDDLNLKIRKAKVPFQKRINEINDEFTKERNEVVLSSESKRNLLNNSDESDYKSNVSVVLTNSGRDKIKVIKVIRDITGMGLKEAKDVVDGTPSTIKENISREEAEKIKVKLVQAGADADII